MSTSPTSPEDDKLQFGKSWLTVIFCIFVCVEKINVQRNVTNVSMFACITVLNSRYMKLFWHDGHKIYTRNSSALGVQSNVSEDDTSQWKLWIGIHLKCIHEQGEYFVHNSKNKRNKCNNLLLYQWSKNWISFRGSWVHTRFLCGISVSQSLVFCAVFVYIIVCLLVAVLSVLWLAYAFHGIDENLKIQWRVGVGWICNKAYSNGGQ
jgi:hypothetical protein